jgi:hypothetical protein
MLMRSGSRRWRTPARSCCSASSVVVPGEAGEFLAEDERLDSAGACAVAARLHESPSRTCAVLRDGELRPVVRYAAIGGRVGLGFGLGTETAGGCHHPSVFR